MSYEISEGFTSLLAGLPLTSTEYIGATCKLCTKSALLTNNDPGHLMLHHDWLFPNKFECGLVTPFRLA